MPPTFVSAITVLILVVLALALQQSAADLAATVIFLVFRPFERGELVETMGRMGDVHEILLFNTVLLLPEQRLVSLPNSKIQANGVVNYTRMGHIRVDFSLTVAYGEDLDRVHVVVTEIASNDAASSASHRSRSSPKIWRRSVCAFRCFLRCHRRTTGPCAATCASGSRPGSTATR